MGNINNLNISNLNKEEEKENDISYDISKEKERKEELENPLEQLFQIFWMKYPKKVSKDYAYKAFMASVKIDDAKDLMDGLEDWIHSKQWKERRYIPNPATFIHQKKWLDELEESDLTDGGVNDFLNDDGDEEKGEIYGDYTKTQ